MNIIKTIITGLFVFLLLCLLGMSTNVPQETGVSFSKEYATSLGLNWKETYIAIVDDLAPQNIRISVPWAMYDDPNSKNWKDLDDMMAIAAKAGVNVTLAIGQKTPRWPECHPPTFESYEEYESSLESYLTRVVTRYKDHPALHQWQVENEPYLLFSFGECDAFDAKLIPQEYDLVRSLDSEHTILGTDSGEFGTLRKAKKHADILGITTYRFSRSNSGKIYHYTLVPYQWYNIRARLLGYSSEEMYIAELQQEPWFSYIGIEHTPAEEIAAMFPPESMFEHREYAAKINVSHVYFWGAEWWYYMLKKEGNNAYWENGKTLLETKTSSN